MYSLILHGRRSLELQKLGILRFAANPFQNASAFSSSFTSSAKKGQNFTVTYLVDSLGLSTKLAQSISRKVSFEDKRSPDSAVDLLKSHGFTDSQISDIVRNYPQVLVADAEKSLAPKLQFLQSRGGATTTFELTEIVSKVPKILGIKKDKAISRYYDFAKEIIKADKSFEHKKLCPSSLPEGSMQENKMRNVLVLRELGVPQRLLFSLLISSSQIVCGKERFEESLKKVVEMGFDPTTTSSKFVQALHAIYQLSDRAVQGKVNVYERLGFAVGDVWAIFKKWPSFLVFSEVKILSSMETFLGLGFSRDEFTTMVKHHPRCIGYSAETVKEKTEFVVKQMNWPLKAVASNPAVLGLSMEKRIVPRSNVIKALKSKGLLGKGGNELPSLSRVFGNTDQAFLNRYVMKHNDKEIVAELMSIFHRR